MDLLQLDLHLRPHPLLQYPIFKRVIKHLDFKDLLHCRVVCSQWKYLVQPLVRTKGKLVVCGDPQFKYLLEVVNQPSNVEKFPSILVLQSVRLQQDVRFGAFGETITSLTLVGCDWDESGDKSLVRVILCQLANLKVLSVRKDRDSKRAAAELSQSRNDHINHKRGLESLVIQGNHALKRHFFCQLLQRSSQHLKVLTYHRNKNYSDSNSFGKWLLNESLLYDLPQLTCLVFDAALEGRQLDAIRKIISLNILSVNIQENMLNVFISMLSHLVNLTCLEIGIIGASAMPPHVVSSIRHSCPAVKRVSIHCPCYPRLMRSRGYSLPFLL